MNEEVVTYNFKKCLRLSHYLQYLSLARCFTKRWMKKHVSVIHSRFMNQVINDTKYYNIYKRSYKRDYKKAP